ncbi:DUF3606 domain-containing protein [Sphingobium olei]|uniref:DUF3606 domain-containing protein n=1 Tax=Sphingobium olei TaxID=420955 RepID=A0ABW3P650_9SPHN|nr:DUF3606 domain-containing protein [Sphingobium sp.]
MTAAQEPPVPADLKRISLDAPLDRQYWSNRFDVPPALLERAVGAVGNEVDAVAAWLRQQEEDG